MLLIQHARKLCLVILGLISISQCVLFAQSLTFTQVTDVPSAPISLQSQAVAWGDYNNDGWEDLFISMGVSVPQFNHLYQNNGNGTFSQVTSGSIVTDFYQSKGCSWGDFNNDGYLDLFVASLLSTRQLYQNNGDGTFIKITSGAAVMDSGVTVGASWVDYDNDSYLDLDVSHAVGPNFLYKGDGTGSGFVRITGQPIVEDVTFTIGSAWADFDNDGDRDVFVPNGTSLGGDSINFFYVNNGDGTFTRDALNIFASDKTVDANGGSWVDYDNDDDLDLYVTGGNPPRVNQLYRNEGPLNNYTFSKIMNENIVTDTCQFCASHWGDLDNDGDLDLFVPNAGEPKYRNRLYVNNGDGTFTSLDSTSLLFEPRYIGSAMADYDNDGDLDIFLSSRLNNNEVSFLHRNDTQNNNNWIKIHCEGTQSNQAALGAKVRLKANINGTDIWQMREISGQSGLLGQSSLIAHFGLGDAVIIDSLRIEWPSGIADVETNIDVNQFVTALEGQGIITGISGQLVSVPQNITLYQNYPNPFNPSTSITYVLPTSSTVTLKVYNLLGQEVKTLVDEHQSAGTKSVVWNGRDNSGCLASSGIYIYTLQAGNAVQSQKMLLVR